ncbi:hypothetical protein NC653_010127 [Populus alba x Populus x berolinensis]|uniref:Piwi domain-containing protein n=1 Tax=Populus alba x Populus x berolinensis TaxID=444605 RepID=A0AAD6R0K1_9ROSI|nr:hypothetical protein NC653_010127 [Populus alba x Populus x berolinensis]
MEGEMQSLVQIQKSIGIRDVLVSASYLILLSYMEGIKPPSMEGIDALLAKNKSSTFEINAHSMTNLLMKKLPAQCSVIFLKKEQNDLLMDLLDIPKKACDRRPSPEGDAFSNGRKTKTQKRLINNLEDEFANSEVKQSSVRKAEGCSLQEVLWKRLFVDGIMARKRSNIRMKGKTCKVPGFLHPNEHVMFMGADVTNPCPLEDINPSVATVIGSMNRPATNKIIFFKDGVSETQFYKVLKEELQAIREACSRFPGYRPSISFAVVQKRHHTRFFPCETDPSSTKNQFFDKNIPPGTPGLPGSTGFHRVDSLANFYLDPDQFQAQVAWIPGLSTGPRKTIEDQTLLNRLGTTDDKVSAVAFSASDDASSITRVTLVVAGGMPSRLSSLS